MRRQWPFEELYFLLFPPAASTGPLKPSMHMDAPVTQSVEQNLGDYQCLRSAPEEWSQNSGGSSSLSSSQDCSMSYSTGYESVGTTSGQVVRRRTRILQPELTGEVELTMEHPRNAVS